LFYSFLLPKILIWSALLLLVLIAFLEFFYKGNYSPIITFYLTATAITIALASVTFAYSRTKIEAESDRLAAIGELFLYSSLSLIMALLITWLSYTAKKYLEPLPSYVYFKALLILTFSSGQLFLFFAATSLYEGLTRLEAYLFTQVKNKIRFWPRE
jgi:hypothetical protein